MLQQLLARHLRIIFHPGRKLREHRPARLPRWFAQVDGDLKLGGRFHVHGNAEGTVTACEPQKHVAGTWEFGGATSWIELNLTPEGDGTRLERSLETMRANKLMKRPVAWIQSGSERWYAFAAAVANPILVAAFARSLTGESVGERRIVLGAVAYAIPYAAMWTLIGFALGEALRAT